MKLISHVLTICSLCLSLADVFACSTSNMVINSGFELGNSGVPDSWKKYGDAARESWASYEGSFGFALYGWVTNGYGGTYQEVPLSESNVTLTASLYALKEIDFNAEAVFVRIKWLNGTTKLGEEEYDLMSLLTTDWQFFSFSFDSYPNATVGRIFIGGDGFNPLGSNGRACKIDNVSITCHSAETVPPPSLFIQINDDLKPFLSWDYQTNHTYSVDQKFSNQTWQTSYGAFDVTNGVCNFEWDTFNSMPKHIWYRIRQSEKIKPGSTHLITASGSTEVTYYRYIPTSFNQETLMPLLFTLDPSGYGYGELKKLRPSCEKYGYILIAANTISNGGDPLHKLRFEEILNDIRNNIPHDPRRVYMAGMSGGAWRALAYSRILFGQFAGILKMGGWIGNYDDYDTWPDQTVIVQLNGTSDSGAMYYGTYDLQFFNKTQTRVHDVTFDGGHEIGPPDSIDEALSFFDNDFATYQTTYYPNTYKVEVPLLYNNALQHYKKEEYQQAVEKSLELLYRYPWTIEAIQIESQLYTSISDTNIWNSLAISTNIIGSEFLSVKFFNMSMGLDQYPYPASSDIHYLNLAITLNPLNNFALTARADMYVNDTPSTPENIATAESLINQAFGISVDLWYSWYVKAWIEYRKGDTSRALLDVETARSKIKYNNSSYKHELIDDAKATFEAAP